MVNINLNQEEGFREAGFKDDDSFQETLNIESHDFGGDQGSFRQDIPEFTKSSTNARIYILAGGLLIVVLFIAYLLFPKKDSEEPDLTALTEPDLIENPVQQNPAKQEPFTRGEPMAGQGESGVPQTQQPPTFDISALSAEEQEAVLSTYFGKLTVDGVTQACANRGIFTLIRFANNSFLVEVITESQAAVDDIAQEVQLNTGADLRIVSREQTQLLGRSVTRALMSGTLSPEQALGAINAPGQPVHDDLPAWIRVTARANQLTVRDLTVSAGFGTNSMQVNLQGSLDAALNFVSRLQEIAGSAVVEKLSLINNDHSATTDSSVSLVLVMKQV